MMKQILSVAVALVAILAEAETALTNSIVKAQTATSKAVAKPKAKAVDDNEEFMRTTGGIILNKSAAKGFVAVIDAQKRVSSDFIKRHILKIEDIIGHRIKYSEAAPPIDFSNVEKTTASAKGNLSVVLLESDTLPNLVSLPEQKCVFINVTSLASDKPDQNKLESRLAKELARGVGFAFVIPYCMAPGGLMDPITSVDQLDKVYVDNLQVAQLPHISKSAGAHFNMTRCPRVTYREACEEGWAPRPRNKFQEAILKEVKSVPKSPLKIIFDPAAQKGKVTK